MQLALAVQGLLEMRVVETLGLRHGLGPAFVCLGSHFDVLVREAVGLVAVRKEVELQTDVVLFEVVDEVLAAVARQQETGAAPMEELQTEQLIDDVLGELVVGVVAFAAAIHAGDEAHAMTHKLDVEVGHRNPNEI